MTYNLKLLSLSMAMAALFSLTACGKGQHQQDGHMDDNGDHAMMDQDKSDMQEGMMPASGTIIKIFAGADRVKIKHEEIPQANMAAMTMSFQTGGDVDLSEFSENDEVYFMLKKGRDGSFRIMKMCPQTDGNDCMADMGH
ncbi:MAG: copper-binding protein [bacterium]